MMITGWNNGHQGDKEDIQITHDVEATDFNQGQQGWALGQGDIYAEC